MCLHIGWEYLLVLEILLQGDAARHNGCELDVVHEIGAGVFGQVFFDDLTSNPANPSDKAGDGRGVEYRLHELVVRHGEVYLGFKIRVLLPHLYGFQGRPAHNHGCFKSQGVYLYKFIKEKQVHLHHFNGKDSNRNPCEKSSCKIRHGGSIYSVLKLFHFLNALFYRNARRCRFRGLYRFRRWRCRFKPGHDCLALVVQACSGNNQSANSKHSP